MTKWFTALAGIALVLLLILTLPLATAPGIVQLLPAPGSTAAPGPVTIGAVLVGARPLQRVELRLNGHPVQPAVFVRDQRTWLVRYETELPRGSYTVTVTVIDDRGHRRTHSWSFLASGPRQPPVLALVEPESDTRFASGPVPVTLRVEAQGDLDSVLLLVDGQPVPPTVTPSSPQGGEFVVRDFQAVVWLEAGEHRVEARVSDEHGARSSGEWTFTVVANVGEANARYFPETGQTLLGAFKQYWESRNGSFVFGPPISPEIRRRDGTTVQYCRYARLELHPDGSITLGLLGLEALGTVQPPVEDPGQPGVRFFPETGHTLRGDFLDFWEQNGGLEAFGFPISEPQLESGYRIQYFERARFEQRLTARAEPQPVRLAPLGELIWQREHKGAG